MIDISKSVFLVDGSTEIRALKAKFISDYGLIPSFRKVGCNGKDVSPDGYANAACGTLLLALRSYFRFIICILDKEKRHHSAQNLADQIKIAIIKMILSKSKYKEKELETKICVCVPDIMFENWIVSDIEGIKKEVKLINQSAKQKYYDGKSGATVLKQIMKTNYRKSLHGPRLFNSTRFNVSKKNSPSFLNFYNVVEF